jgi:ATP-dependent DNA ligase
MGLGYDRRGHEKMPRSKPRLVAAIEFLEWTPDGLLRHPKFVAQDASINAGSSL